MNNNNIHFSLNGYKLSSTSKLRIIDILRYFNYRNSLFVIEYNNLISNPKEWAQLKIKSNDKIEVISIVGGG